ncbi:hypothetical protein QQ045_015989 [Rhodiola kirilowii]
MGKQEDKKCVFPLTSLQIGDLQSYLSHVSLFVGPKRKRCYLLVDNRPWLEGLVSRPAQLWQLMVTKSRLSPFANTRGRKNKQETIEIYELKDSPKSSSCKSRKHEIWFSLIDAATLSQKKALLPVKKLKSSLLLNSRLHTTFHGLIVFEVSWDDVRGINYVNELQTDTSLALEAKFMKRWEFDSVGQAASCLSSWFSGSAEEKLLMENYLEGSIDEEFHDASDSFTSSTDVFDDGNTCRNGSPFKENSPSYSEHSFGVYPIVETTECSGNEFQSVQTPPLKKRKVLNSTRDSIDGDMCSVEKRSEPVDTSEPVDNPASGDNKLEFEEYKDVLLLLRFNDRDLPFRLRDIIMSDLRLLTLLESGLPSWVLFLQSYPGFCHLYRPWMCPLVRTLYVLVSLVTVLIGFYDLYKNVPLLKATASRLCGPLFDWIENWEMISRIRYLGTMLFLHNCEKAIKWFLMITRTAKSFLSVITQPVGEVLIQILGFLVPVWNICMELVESVWSILWIVFGSSFSIIANIVQFLLEPIWFIVTFTWNLVTAVLYPIFWVVWEIMYAPIRLVLGLANFVAFIYEEIYEFVEEVWIVISSFVKIASASEATVTTYEVSIWRSLWNDLFSQIFRAVKSILNGFVAFFTACNRHRLSIYNHTQEFIQRVCGSPQIPEAPTTSNDRRGKQDRYVHSRRAFHPHQS